jgi:hypothetical protein
MIGSRGHYSSSANRSSPRPTPMKSTPMRVSRPCWSQGARPGSISAIRPRTATEHR